MSEDTDEFDPTPRRPSDALRAAMNDAELADAAPGRLGTFEVQTLMALRRFGWDVTRLRQVGWLAAGGRLVSTAVAPPHPGAWQPVYVRDLSGGSGGAR